MDKLDQLDAPELLRRIRDTRDAAQECLAAAKECATIPDDRAQVIGATIGFVVSAVCAPLAGQDPAAALERLIAQLGISKAEADLRNLGT